MMGGSKMVMLLLLSLFLILLELGWWSEGCLEQERFALLQLKHNFNNHPMYLQDWVDESYSDCCQWQSVLCNATTSRVIAIDLLSLNIASALYLNFSLFTPFQQLESLDLSGNNIAGCVENEGLEKLSGLSNLKFLDLSHNSFNNSVLSSLAGLSSLKNLSLAYNRLEGSINIEGMTMLESLDLSGNKFNRSILSSLTALSSLRKLNLMATGFKGTFDVQELDSLSNLEGLDMSDNEIDNLVVPKDYRGLRKLRFLDLSGLRIRDGSKVLHSIGSFPSLKTLYLKSNNFAKTVTTTQELHKFTNLEELAMDYSPLHRRLLQIIASFTSLKILSMRVCRLNGVLPGDQGLCELAHLQELYIDHNDFIGSLPWCLANLTSLRVLHVPDNQLTGNLSSSPLMHLTSIELLILSNNHFQIPMSLEPFFNYSKLKIFHGRENQIFGEIESSHSSLTPKFQLTSISLSDHGDSDGGTIPKFLYHQHHLEFVIISDVNMRGEFPSWLLENNTNLRSIILANNSLSGPFRLPTRSRKNIIALDISYNKLQGHIPVEIGKVLPNLGFLTISFNAFNGSIPSSFGDMNSLIYLDLSNNQLTGEIPEHLAMGCFNLEYLLLSNNSLQGQLFSKKINLTKLKRLNLDGNHFIGGIPESLSNCSSLQGLYISDNDISGSIPTWMGNISFLDAIIMPDNHLEGPIPSEFCQLDYLEILDLSKNNIAGSLPSCFHPSTIRQVHLSKNMLQGPLNGAFSKCSYLLTLDLCNNRLNGNIPNWMGRLSQLRYLILANNNFEGEVPLRLCQLQKLRLLDLSHNNLSGQIPPCLDNTSLHREEGYYDLIPTYRNEYDIVSYNVGPSMGEKETIDFTTKERSYTYKGQPLESIHGLDLSCNKLIGEIPSRIGELIRIHTLNLSRNNLTGTIPVTFSNLRQVESLDLSYNNLTGKIPPRLIELNALAVFSVAHNNLSSKIPERIAQFATFDEDSYEGNPFLCGPPLRKICNENRSSLEASTHDDEEDDNLIDMDSFYITFTVSSVIVILGIIGVLWVNPYWRHRWFYLVEILITSCYYFVVDNLIPRRSYCSYRFCA